MTHYVTRQEITEFASTREISDEIAQAILELAAGDAERAQEIWENGDEADQVIARAWGLAGAETDTLHWGDVIDRPQVA